MFLTRLFKDEVKHMQTHANSSLGRYKIPVLEYLQTMLGTITISTTRIKNLMPSSGPALQQLVTISDDKISSIGAIIHMLGGLPDADVAHFEEQIFNRFDQFQKQIEEKQPVNEN